MTSNINLVSQGQSNRPHPLVSIYWDCQNIKINFNPYLARYLLIFARLRGCLASQKAYANWRSEKLVLEQHLHDIGFDCIDVPLNTKNSVDKKLIADCSREVSSNSSAEIFIFVTGDYDFAKLVQFLLDKEKKVIILAQKDNASPRLIELASEVHFVDELPELIKHKDEVELEIISYSDAITCLVEAIEIAIKQGKPTSLSLVGNLMRCNPNFPNYQGISSIRTPNGITFRQFKDFITAVVAEGKVQVRTVGNFQELLLIQENTKATKKSYSVNTDEGNPTYC